MVFLAWCGHPRNIPCKMLFTHHNGVLETIWIMLIYLFFKFGITSQDLSVYILCSVVLRLSYDFSSFPLSLSPMKLWIMKPFFFLILSFREVHKQEKLLIQEAIISFSKISSARDMSLLKSCSKFLKLSEQKLYWIYAA